METSPILPAPRGVYSRLGLTLCLLLVLSQKLLQYVLLFSLRSLRGPDGQIVAIVCQTCLIRILQVILSYSYTTSYL